MMGLLGGVTVGLLMAGAVFLSNAVTNLRAGIAVLESRKCCMEVEYAHLQTSWNQATSPQVIIERARKTGLDLPTKPTLVLVRSTEQEPTLTQTWQHLLGGLGGGSVAQATTVPAPRRPAGLVSLVPRAAAGAEQ